MKHICIDLETLGNNPCAPIIQLGAVKFDENGATEVYIENIQYVGNQLDKFRCDYSTIMWWMQQPDEARNTLHEYPIQLADALIRFTEWIEEPEEFTYWSMASFDFPILRNAYDVCNLVYPIPFRNHRDFRTIVDLVQVPRDTFVGIKHFALDDAIDEAKTINKCLKKLT